MPEVLISSRVQDSPVQDVESQDVVIEPRDMAVQQVSMRDDVRACTFRREMGLPLDRPIVMSGHQAGFWHCGIVAKYIAASTLARTIGAHAAWLVADLDDNDPTSVRFPVAAPRMHAELCDLSAGGAMRGVATGFRPPVSVRTPIPSALSHVGMAMDSARARAESLADQVHQAAETLLEQASLIRVESLLASRMMRSELFADVCARMQADPVGCVRTYNEAVQAEPEAGMRGLLCREGRCELPVWRCEPGKPRQPVLLSAGQQLETRGLAPRALLMTGLLRLAGCDLFVHGTGGGVYDRITDRWFSSWLGEHALSPVMVVSATRRLALGVEPMSEREEAHAIGLGHRARHEPGLVGDSVAAQRKRELVAQIAAMPRKSAQRARAYDELQQLLERVRIERSEAVAQLQARSAEIRDHREALELARDRTWSFALHPASTLLTLRDEIERRLAAMHRAQAC